nr:50S ribosomal protein L9 [Ishige okamurae]
MTKRAIEIILAESIPRQGNRGDLIKIKPGYFRNYIVPLKLGQRVTAARVKQYNIQQNILKIKKEKFLEECLVNKNVLENLKKFQIKRHVGEEGKIFGKITNRRIIELIKSKGSSTLELTKDQLKVPEIKRLGEYPVQIDFTNNITATIILEVLPK